MILTSGTVAFFFLMLSLGFVIGFLVGDHTATTATRNDILDKFYLKARKTPISNVLTRKEGTDIK